MKLLADIFCYANFFIGCESGDIQGNQLIRDSHILSFPKRWPIWCRAPRCLCVPLKTKMTDAQKRAQGGPCTCVLGCLWRAVSVRVISFIVFFLVRGVLKYGLDSLKFKMCILYCMFLFNLSFKLLEDN